MKLSRFLIYMLVVVVIVILGGTWIASRKSQELSMVDVTDQPTIGDPTARIHVVVFEEPKCGDCRQYNNQIFPLIKQEFIDSNQITYTVVPISFLPHSMAGAVALLCVYNQDPGFPNADLFIKFLDNLFKNEWTTPEDVVQIAAKTTSAIDIAGLRTCIACAAYEPQIRDNLAWAKKLQEERFFVPAIYVNGKRVTEVSYDSIKEAILNP